MPLPPSVTAITVTGSFFETEPEAPLAGVVVTITPQEPGPHRVPADDEMLMIRPETGTSDVDGDISVIMAGSFDPAISPGTLYDIELSGAIEKTYTNVLIPWDAPGGTIDLTDILPGGAEDEGHAYTLSALEDVDLDPAPSDGDALVFDTADEKWKPGAGAGGGASDLNDLTDVDTATVPPTVNQVLLWDGTSLWKPGAVGWTEVTGKPTEFTPAAHTHDAPAWDDVTDKPATFPPTLPIAITGVTDLQTELDAKANTVHTHVIGDTTDLQTTLDGKLVAASNLSDLTDAAAARTSLGLGGSATLDVGTTAGTVAAGDDPRLGVTRPWIFDVTDPVYGAVGDGKITLDGSMTSGTATLSCASGPFTAGDVGKAIMVSGAAALGVTSLVSTISGFTSATTVTLANNATTTVAGVQVLWGTDDTGAFRDAVNDAVAYAQAGGGAATVFIPAATQRFYAIASAPVTGSPTLGNAQIPLPVIDATDPKISLTFEGVSNGSATEHWQQLSPTFAGSTLVSFAVNLSISGQSTAISTDGNPSVIGGPTPPNNYGQAALFSNMMVTLKNMSILTAISTFGLTYTAFDFYGCANANLMDFGYGGASSVPQTHFQNPPNFANGLAIGGLMPAPGNNDNSIIRNVTCHGGYTYAIFTAEHTVIDAARLLYCWSALVVVGTYDGSVGSVHGVDALQLSIEACTNLIHIFGVGSSGIGPFINANIDTELSNPGFHDQTSGTGLAAARGTIRLGGLYNPANITVTGAGGTGLKIIDTQKSSPVRAVSASATVRVTDEVLTVDATAGAVTITLISAANTPNIYTVKKIDSSGNAVTVAAAAGQTIDGATTVSLPAQYDVVTVVPAGGNWITV